MKERRLKWLWSFWKCRWSTGVFTISGGLTENNAVSRNSVDKKTPHWCLGFRGHIGQTNEKPGTQVNHTSKARTSFVNWKNLRKVCLIKRPVGVYSRWFWFSCHGGVVQQFIARGCFHPADAHDGGTQKKNPKRPTVQFCPETARVKTQCWPRNTPQPAGQRTQHNTQCLQWAAGSFWVRQ